MFMAAQEQLSSMLHEHQRRVLTMIDALPEAIYTTDAEGRVTHFNPAAVELSGRQPELGTDRWCISWKLYRPDGTPLPHGQCPMAIALKEGRAIRGQEIIAERPDGKRIWVMPYPTPLFDDEGNVVGGINMLVDITEHKLAEEAKARLAAIVDFSDDAIVGKTLDGIITSWNRGAEKIFGFTAAEAIGQHITLIIPEEGWAQEDEVLSRLRRGEKIDHFETERRAKDGRKVQVSLSVSPIRDSSGRIIGAAKIARDITETKRAEEHYRAMQKLESIGVLAGGIAHDFNNLLTGILGNASLAVDMLPANHSALSLLNDVVRASENAARLTQQMLAYAGKGQFVLKAIHLSELVQEITRLIQASIPRTVQLDLNLERRLPPIDADPNQLQQLVMNLVINGAEAIGEDQTGVVHVTTAIQDIDEEEASRGARQPKIQPGRYVLLQVEDNGCGMDESTRLKIFDPFFTTKFLGRGLGLAAALGIVRSHKGSIEVSSRPGEGSTFRVLLPASETWREKNPDREVEKTSRPKTILVVDDEEIVRRTASAALKTHGYQVLLASNGQEAVDLFARMADEISLILLDLTMPVLSGQATLRSLQAIRTDVPVILSSGYNQAEAFRRFREASLAGFIQKPYKAAKLVEIIAGVLDSTGDSSSVPEPLT
jgi:PAS domain S-box-containing protein